MNRYGTVRSPLGPRTIELSATTKPTRNMERYTSAVAGELRVAAAARRVRSALIVRLT